MKLVLLISLLSSCAWKQRTIGPYPSGWKIIKGDQNMLNRVCGHVKDNGERFKSADRAVACWDDINQIAYLLDNCEGAEALTHELAHKEGIAEPEKSGFNW